MADAFEREQMPGVGEVLLRRKVTSPRKIMALMTGIPLGVGALASVGLLIAGLLIPATWACWAFAVFMSALFTLLNVMFASARLVVSEGEFHLQLGHLGATHSHRGDCLGEAGARSAADDAGWACAMTFRARPPTSSGVATRRCISRKRDGKKLVLVIQDAEPIVEAISKLALQAPRHAPRVRVEGVADAPLVASTNAVSSNENEDAEAQQELVRSHACGVSLVSRSTFWLVHTPPCRTRPNTLDALFAADRALRGCRTQLFWNRHLACRADTDPRQGDESLRLKR